MKTSAEWKEMFPEMINAGVPDVDFFKKELTNEAMSIHPYIPKDEPFVGVELGVCFAKSSCILLHRFPLLKLILVDSWHEYPNTQIVARANLSEFDSDRYRIIHSDSTEAGRNFNEKVDYVFVDAHKQEDKYYDDIMTWYPHIKEGGVMIGHDIDNPDIGDNGQSARRGVEKAAKELGVEFTVNSRRYSWVIQK
jgi:predicted O-methyltransferase YrrM